MAELAILAVAASLTSGAVAYMGAQQQAKALDKQAKSAEAMGEYNAQIEMNNAQAQAQDLQFQAGVEAQNKSRSLQDSARAAQLHDDKVRKLIASDSASLNRRGALSHSFDDILRSSALLAEREEADIYSEGAKSRYGMDSQANLYREQGHRAMEQGYLGATMSRLSGQNQAFSLRSRANDARWRGIGAAVGGVANASATGSSAWG